MRLGYSNNNGRVYWNPSALALCNTCCTEPQQEICSICDTAGYTPLNLTVSWSITWNHTNCHPGSSIWYWGARDVTFSNLVSYGSCVLTLIPDTVVLKKPAVCLWEGQIDVDIADYTVWQTRDRTYNGSVYQVGKIFRVTFSVEGGWFTVGGWPPVQRLMRNLWINFYSWHGDYPNGYYTVQKFFRSLTVGDLYLSEYTPEASTCMAKYSADVSSSDYYCDASIDCYNWPPFVGDKVSIIESNNCTTYSEDEDYGAGSCVAYMGEFYECHTGYSQPPVHLPTDTSYWTKLT